MVGRLPGPLRHPTVDPDHGFPVEAGLQAAPLIVGGEYQLRQAVVIAQIDKAQAAVIAHPVHQTLEAHHCSGVLGAKGPAGMCSIRVHIRYSFKSRALYFPGP